MKELIESIVLKLDSLSITFKAVGLSKHLDIEFSETESLSIVKPMKLRRRGQEMKMVIGGVHKKMSHPDPALIKVIAKAHLLKIELDSGQVDSIKAFAAKHNIDHGDAKNMIPLSYLAPSIVEDIMAGHQPADLTARRLKYLSDLPMNWQDQRQFLGFH